MTERVYTQYDLIEEWKKMPMIPREHRHFKTIPLEELDAIGWRWDEAQQAYFIPYFSRSKLSIPFAQYRYGKDAPVRFKFLKDAKPTMYGTWNLDPNMAIFLVEGTSDGLVLEYCAVPWIAMPSASSGALMKPFAEWCMANGVEIIYAGDNDEAGNKLLEALDAVAPYRIKQPPKKYKDWGDFLVAEGQEAVILWCDQELNPTVAEPEVSEEKVAEIAAFMAEPIDVKDSGDGKTSKEPENPSPPLLY